MSETTQVVSFTVEEINQILTVLGDVPAKYSIDLLTFIRGKAQEQLKDVAPVQTEEVAE